MKKRMTLIRVSAVAAVLVAVGVLWHKRDAEPSFGPLTDRDLAAARLASGERPVTEQVIDAPMIDARTRVRVAIGGLGLREELDGEAADLTLAKLSGVPGLDLVERRELNKALEELQLSLSGLVRAQDALRVGKMVRADWFVLGSPFNLGGTNSIVVRIVDARTGVLRDAGFLSAGAGPESVASGVAARVQLARTAATTAKNPVFLGLGGFDNLGVNDRLQDLPTQLRAGLTAAYRGSDVVLVEREQVEALLREIALDTAGLGDPSSNGSPGQVQPAFWLVEGSYQSYETSKREVELKVSVDRVYGRDRETALRGDSGPALCDQVKAFIDKTMREEGAKPVFGRKGEASWEVGAGARLAGINERFGAMSAVLSGDGMASGSEAIAARNTTEAIRAFESALLLEPDNRKAEAFLAACLQRSYIGRGDDARDLYRRIIDEGKADDWERPAEEALRISWFLQNPSIEAAWYQAAEGSATNTAAAGFYHREGIRARDRAVALEPAKAASDAGQRVFFDVISNYISGRFGGGDWGVRDYVQSLGQASPDEIALRLKSMLPELKIKFPAAYPFLVARFTCYQTSANSPVFREFEELYPAQLAEIASKTQLAQKDYDCLSALRGVVDWGVEHTNFPLVIEILTAMRTAQANSSPPPDEDRLALGCAYERTRQWKLALEIFETYSNRPVNVGGRLFGNNVFFPSAHCAICRQKLGLPDGRDPREFEISDGVNWGGLFSFSAGSDGLWVAVNGRLLKVGYDLKTNAIYDYGAGYASVVTSICATPSTIWIGTDETGIVAFDRASRSARKWTQEDGLLMNSISALGYADGRLWIGFGHRIPEWSGKRFVGRGGIGMLDTATGKVTSFGASINDPNNVIPDRPAWDLAVSSGRDVWVAAESVLLRWRGSDQQWDSPNLPSGVVSAAAGADEVAVIALQAKAPLGLRVSDLDAKLWREIQVTNDVPFGVADTVRIVDGQTWVGGMGYVAKINTREMRLKRFALINSPYGVRDIQAGGGMLWVQKDWWLLHAPLPE